MFMPAQYEAIRDDLIKRGKGEKEAKRIAAATYNARHPGHPMRPHRRRRRKHKIPKPDERGFY
jgi:hypothetical protein